MRHTIPILALAGSMMLGPASALAADKPATPAKPETPAADPPPKSAAPAAGDAAKPDAALRTFAGSCLFEPAGSGEQSRLLTALGDVLGPQLLGASIDALTAALDEAGQDHVTSLTATLPLETAPRCIQIARGVTLSSRGTEDAASFREALSRAPFMVEFYLRQSADGSALSVMPTMLRYQTTIDGKKSSRTERDLFATLTFKDASGAKSVTVSVPLGSFAPSKGAPDRGYDPVGAPTTGWIKAGLYPTGAGASGWFSSLYTAPATAKASSEPDKDNSDKPSPVTPTGDGFGPAAPAPDVKNQPSPPPKPTPSAGDIKRNAQVQSTPLTFARGAPIAPISVVVVLRETRPGNPVARFFSAVLKGSKTKIVDSVDPEKVAAAKDKEADARTKAIEAYATALSDFYKKKGDYCTAVAKGGEALPIQQKGADLLGSEIKLSAAAKGAGEKLPFGQFVDPETGAGAACPV